MEQVLSPVNRGEAREQEILDTALDLIAEVGYERMSMDSLAARARASKATLYRRWPGKAQLVTEAIRHRACYVSAGPPDTGSLRGDLLASLRDQRDVLTGQDGPLLVGLIKAAQGDVELASLLREQFSADKAAVAEALLARAIARREVPSSTKPGLIPEIVPALLLMRLLVTDQPTDDAYLTHVVDDILLPVLRGCPTPTSTSPDPQHIPDHRHLPAGSDNPTIA